MFKRRSETVEAQPEAPVGVGGKGRPTPSRKTAEAARAARVKPPKDSREAKRLDRQRAISDRTAARKGMAAGDPRYLPARDRGPARAWIRTFIDSRWSPGELVLPSAGVVFALGFISPAAYLLFYALIVAVLFDSVVLARRVTRGVKENFPDTPTQGLRMYAVLRASQMRFMRMPKPANKRRLFGGAKP